MEIKWTKTLMTVHKYLERICDAIDRLVETNAINSFYVSGVNFVPSSVEVVANKILSLSSRKVTLINLKVLTEDALSLCDEWAAKILIEKYIDGAYARDIAERNGFSMRTYFRRLASAESNFLEKLARLGYNDAKLFDMLKDEKWIMEIYSRFNKDSEVSIDEKDLRRAVRC